MTRKKKCPNHRELAHIRDISADPFSRRSRDPKTEENMFFQGSRSKKRVVMQLFGSLFDAPSVTGFDSILGLYAGGTTELRLQTNLCNINSPDYADIAWDSCWFNDWSLSARYPINPHDSLLIKDDDADDGYYRMKAPGTVALYTTESFDYDTAYAWSAVGCRMAALPMPSVQ